MISRQAAIDVTWKEPSYTDPLNVLTEVRDRIKALPSAQPEPICGLPVSADRPLADVEIVSRLRDIQKQIPGGERAREKYKELTGLNPSPEEGEIVIEEAQE